LPFALPDLDDEELQEIREALESGWITTGPKVSKFEAEFARTVGAKHAIAVNSCTAAMHLALEAIGVQRGDEVIIPVYTFAATAEVVRYFDATPVFVDIDPLTFNIDVDRIEEKITPRTKAIIPVHVGGLFVRIERLLELSERHGIAVIEDAAHADPLAYGRWNPISHSRSELPNAEPRHRSTSACFSFYATKTMTTGEGGMIATDDDRIAERCRIMALHGISKDAWKRYTAEGSWYYEIVAPGYKYNMTDVAAAMGLAQLRKAERMLNRRRQIAELYTAAFSQMSNLEPPAVSENHAWHLYMLRLSHEAAGQKSVGGSIDAERLWKLRAQFVAQLKARNIGASVHFIPLHIHPYYRQTYGYTPEDFPIAYREYLREVSLPIYSKMTDDDVADVIAAVQECADALS
jgi:perosamine synthetase